jgi:signal transduction histidine kinase
VGKEMALIDNSPMQILGALAAGIAHEFNNELTVILSIVDDVMDELGSEHPATNELQYLRLAARRCVANTQSLLAFTHRVDPEIRPVDLQSFFAAAERTLPN